jgi:NAD(P)-dependent dehydrogenase (short-subunit alcohol dehydrogenase family)
MGQAAAVKFAAEGALVIGTDINVEGSDATVRRVKDAGGDMVSIGPFDLSEPTQAGAWIDQAARVHGRIDVLYNNAGLARFAPLETFPVADWHFTMKNEIDIVFFVTQHAWPYLRESHGVIITAASVAGHLGLTGQIAHCTGKGAVLAMSRAFAAEGAPYGIRAFTISPGPIETEGTRWYFDDPVTNARSREGTLLQRIGHVDEVANVAVFLASDESSYMTGSDIPVDAGTIIKR